MKFMRALNLISFALAIFLGPFIFWYGHEVAGEFIARLPFETIVHQYTRGLFLMFTDVAIALIIFVAFRELIDSLRKEE